MPRSDQSQIEDEDENEELNRQRMLNLEEDPNN